MASHSSQLAAMSTATPPLLNPPSVPPIVPSYAVATSHPPALKQIKQLHFLLKLHLQPNTILKLQIRRKFNIVIAGIDEYQSGATRHARQL